MKYYFTVLRKYANVEGRASRAEYWNFILFSYLISVAIAFVEIKLGTHFLSMTYLVAILLPSLAVSMRRMHDLGKYGCYALIPVYSLILACLPSQKGYNSYGPDPKTPKTVVS
jgi:uncharacterized membrane protein YhaH (DUF805 family)